MHTSVSHAVYGADMSATYRQCSYCNQIRKVRKDGRIRGHRLPNAKYECIGADPWRPWADLQGAIR